MFSLLLWSKLSSLRTQMYVRSSGTNCQAFELRCTCNPTTAQDSRPTCGFYVYGYTIPASTRIQEHSALLSSHFISTSCFIMSSHDAMHPEVPHDGNPSHGLPLAMDGNLLVLHSTKLPRTGHAPGTPAPSTGFILHGLHAVRASFLLHASYFIPARHAVQPPHRHPMPPGVLPFLLLSSISSCVRPCRCVFRTVRLVSSPPSF